MPIKHSAPILLLAISSALTPAFAADAAPVIMAPTTVEPHAQKSEFYAAIRGTIAIPSDFTFDFTTEDDTFTTIQSKLRKQSYGFSMAFGRNQMLWGKNARLEAEFGKLNAETESHMLTSMGDTYAGENARGEHEISYAMANIAIDMSEVGAFKPFLKAGLGYAKVNFIDQAMILGVGGAYGMNEGPNTLLHDEANGLAWQVGAGASMALSSTLDVEANYSYFNVEGISIPATSGDRSEIDLSNHKFDVGLRVNF